MYSEREARARHSWSLKERSECPPIVNEQATSCRAMCNFSLSPVLSVSCCQDHRLLLGDHNTSQCFDSFDWQNYSCIIPFAVCLDAFDHENLALQSLMFDRGGPKASASSPLVQLVTPICEINGWYSHGKVSILRPQHVDVENDTCFLIQTQLHLRSRRVCLFWRKGSKETISQTIDLRSYGHTTAFVFKGRAERTEISPFNTSSGQKAAGGAASNMQESSEQGARLIWAHRLPCRHVCICYRFSIGPISIGMLDNERPWGIFIQLIVA